ncbi:3'-5' exonuclease [Serratia bockelmannii]|uniref:3'-5' exonuclease n=1 Tax=Serratia bockelmannii TaxID=2703793 RepID=UPI003FA6DBE0
MSNIMIDIETLGKKRGCPVLSIAAVQFDLQTGNVGETFYERMSCDAALSYGAPEISTLEWWSKQSDEARDAAFKGERHPVSVAAELRAFLQRAGGGRCIPWGNGSVFDISILEGWFDKVDPLVDAKGDDIYPWKFWDIADLRTLVRLSGINVKAIPFAGEKHNALADALHQVKIAHAAYSALPSPNRGTQPVAWRHDDGPFAGMALTRSKSVADSWIANGWTVTPLFPAPPAPAVPDESENRDNFEKWVADYTGHTKGFVSQFRSGARYQVGSMWNKHWDTWSACRATMLALEQGNGGYDGKISD